MRLFHYLIALFILAPENKDLDVLHDVSSIAVPRYAKMTDTVFHIGDLIQHDFKPRFALGPRYATAAEKAGIHASDSSNYKHFLELVDFIKTHPNLILELGSHTDFRGNAESNVHLSQRRAEAIVRFMVSEYGIDSSQITAKGYGRENPSIIFSCNGFFFSYPDDSLALNCVEEPIPIELNNDFINTFKADKITFERLHQFNRRHEVKVIGIVR